MSPNRPPSTTTPSLKRHPLTNSRNSRADEETKLLSKAAQTAVHTVESASAKGGATVGWGAAHHTSVVASAGFGGGGGYMAGKGLGLKLGLGLGGAGGPLLLALCCATAGGYLAYRWYRKQAFTFSGDEIRAEDSSAGGAPCSSSAAASPLGAQSPSKER